MLSVTVSVVSSNPSGAVVEERYTSDPRPVFGYQQRERNIPSRFGKAFCGTNVEPRTLYVG